MQEGWASGCVIQREEEQIQKAGDVRIPGPGVETERDGLGMKRDNARNILLIALDVWSKL